MCVRTSVDSERQDAAKTTSALADSRICSFMKMMTLYIFVVVITIFLSLSPFLSPSVVTMSTSKPIGVCLVNRWKKGSAERVENCYYESLAFLRNLMRKL